MGDRGRMSGVTHQNLIGYISATSKPIHFWFSTKLSAVQGLQTKLATTGSAPHFRPNFEILNLNP